MKSNGGLGSRRWQKRKVDTPLLDVLAPRYGYRLHAGKVECIEIDEAHSGPIQTIDRPIERLTDQQTDAP